MRKAIVVAGLVLIFALVIIGIVISAEPVVVGEPCTEGKAGCSCTGGQVKESPNLLTNPSFEITEPSS